MQPFRSGLGVSMSADADARFPPFPLSQKIQLGVQQQPKYTGRYRLVIGKEELAANKAAMANFSVWMNREAQARADVLIAGLLKDLPPPAKR